MAKPCPQEEITNKLNNAYRQLLKKQQLDNSPKQTYTLFNLEMLLKNNENDIELSKNVGQLFIVSWQKDEKQWLNAIESNDHKHIQILAHKLKGSIRYFSRDEITQTIIALSQHAKDKKSNDIKISATLLYQQLDTLINEISTWLSSKSF